MKTKKTTFNKSFYLRERKNSNGVKITIEAKITINGETTHFNTGIEITDKKKWISKASRLLGKTPIERTINTTLENITDEIDCFYYYFLNTQGSVTPVDIKTAILAKRDQKQQEILQVHTNEKNKKNFFTYFDEFNEIKKLEVSKKTYSRYLTTRNRFAAYFRKITRKKPEQIEFTDLPPLSAIVFMET